MYVVWVPSSLLAWSTSTALGSCNPYSSLVSLPNGRSKRTEETRLTNEVMLLVSNVSSSARPFIVHSSPLFSNSKKPFWFSNERATIWS